MVLGQPNNKCPHGVYLAGEATAKYCGFCNPTSLNTVATCAAHNVPEVEEREETLDCFEFMNQGAGRRLAAATSH